MYLRSVIPLTLIRDIYHTVVRTLGDKLRGRFRVGLVWRSAIHQSSTTLGGRTERNAFNLMGPA